MLCLNFPIWCKSTFVLWAYFLLAILLQRRQSSKFLASRFSKKNAPVIDLKSIAKWILAILHRMAIAHCILQLCARFTSVARVLPDGTMSSTNKSTAMHFKMTDIKVTICFHSMNLIFYILLVNNMNIYWNLIPKEKCAELEKPWLSQLVENM